MTDTDASTHQGKAAAILAAARRLFLRQGFANASMDAVAQEAGVAKQTVYNHFGSKEDLLATLIRSRCQEITTSLAVDQTDGEPGVVLRRFARHFFQVLLSHDGLAMNRLLMIEVQHTPELGKLWYSMGPKRTHEALTAYFTKLNQRGRLDIPDPQRTAELFLGMLSGIKRMHLLAEPDARLDAGELGTYVDLAVETILKAHRVTTEHSADLR